MSPLRERLKEALGIFLMLSLTAFGLALPALYVLPLSQEWVRTALITVLLAFAWAVSGIPQARWPRLFVLGIIAGFTLRLARWALPAFWAVVRAVMDGNLSPALFLYSDVLIPLGVFLLLLVCGPVVLGDPAFSAPLYLGMLLMMWFLGARTQVLAYLPAAIALPMLFVFARSREAGREQAGKPTTARRALPVVAVIAVIALLLTPAYRTTVPALENQADRLRQWIEDHFFFTDSRNMFSLRGQGWQPLGDQGLGGTPQVSPGAVMSVTTDRKAYLRGTIYNHYSGRSWHDTVSSDRYGYGSIRYAGLRDALLDGHLPVDGRAAQAQVGVRMLSDAPSTLFTPQRVREFNAGDGVVPYFNDASELFATRDLREGDAWKVWYEPYVSGRAATDDLARALRGTSDPRYADILPVYTALPAHLQPEGITAQLARDIIRGITDPYTQAQAIEQHLRTRYRYTLSVEEPPPDVDFAAHFLFETREGYCTYFATAMTVLARSVGLPARYVEGFVARPMPGGATVVTGQEAHAWTEIYIAGLGWVTFDATASQGEDDPGTEDGDPEEAQPSPEGGTSPSPPPAETPTPPPEDEPEGDNATPTPPPPGETPQPSDEPQSTQEPDQGNTQPPDPPRFPWWLLAMLAIGLFVWRMIVSAPDKRAGKASDDTARLLIYWQAATRSLAARGQGQQDSETLLEHAHRTLPPDAQPAAQAVSAVIYGRANATARDVAAARAVHLNLWRGLPFYKRAGLALTRTVRDILGSPGRLWRVIRKPARGNRRRVNRGGR